MPKKMFNVNTDLDLPEAYRTQANMWKACYFEARGELVKANKGLRRLRFKVNLLQEKLKTRPERNHFCYGCVHLPNTTAAKYCKSGILYRRKKDGSRCAHKATEEQWPKRNKY